MSNNLIPIMTCFNDNYVIPAGVCFYSLLKNSNCNNAFKIYVLNTDITPQNKSKLSELVGQFKNADIEFLDMGNKFENLFAKTKTKAHYSKEIYYKYLAPELFLQYDKIIITDVDVLFLSDISYDFCNFNVEDDYYLAACRPPYRKSSNVDFYKNEFTLEEKKRLLYAGGYYIFNSKLMRKDNISNNLIEYTMNNLPRLKQPEQDVINLVCYGKIKTLPSNALVCTYAYQMYKNDDYREDVFYNEAQVKYSLENPVQLHYAGKQKPWNTPDCIKSEIWYEYLKQTLFFMDLIKTFKPKPKTKRLVKLKLNNVIYKLEKEYV